MAGLRPGFWFGGLRVQLGSLVFGEVDADGTHWHIDTLEGWDSAEVRADLQQRQADHGAWPTPIYLSERPVSLGGKVVAQSRALLDAALERLYAATPLDDTTLTVYESIPKCATVRRSGKTMAHRLTPVVAEWSALMTAPDPRRYEVTERSGSAHLPTTSGGLTLPAVMPWTLSAVTVIGQVDATNAGSFETRPQLVLDGPVHLPSVLALLPDGTASSLAYSQDLAAGDQLVIDTDTHTAVLNGSVSRRRFLAVTGGWPTIPAGATVSYQFRAGSYNSSALLTVRWRSAWI
jgi:Phage tail protein